MLDVTCERDACLTVDGDVDCTMHDEWAKAIGILDACPADAVEQIERLRAAIVSFRDACHRAYMFDGWTYGSTAVAAEVLFALVAERQSATGKDGSR